MARADKSPKLDAGQRRGFAVLTFTQTCNIASYQLLLSGFLVLYAAQMGLSPAMIGVLGFLVQAPVLLQMPLARWFDSHGAARFVRVTLLIGPIAALPAVFAPQVTNAASLSMGQAALVIGVVLYVISTQPIGAAWLPLLRANLPQGSMTELIGRMNRVSMAIGVSVTLGASLLLLGGATLFQFQAIFFVALVLAALRGVFLTRLSDIVRAPSPPRLPIWGGLRLALSEQHFRRLLILVLIMTGTACFSSAFRALLFTHVGFSASFAALVTVPVGMASYALSARWWGAVADRYGTKGVYGLAGIGVLIGHLLLALIPGTGPLGAVMAIVGVALNWGCWAGVESGNLRRLFSVAPKEGGAFHMALFTITVSASVAIGTLLGGMIVSSARHLIGPMPEAAGLSLALDYRILFLISAIGSIVGIAYSRRMMPIKEVPASRLLLYLRIRTQRALMGGITGLFFRRPLGDDTD